MKDIIVRSPGRINLIGEHTDYNEGFVLPAAINKYVTVQANKRQDSNISLFAKQFNETFEVSIEHIKPIKGHWCNYILGVVDQLLKKGLTVDGFDMVIDGDIPVGAGMSSSAAVECAVVYALNELFDLKITKLNMVLIAQAAEHTYPGVKCGIMDQYASMFGKKGMALRLDCREHTHQYIPLQLEEYKIVLFNTNVKHSLASSAYNQRRQECEEGVRLVQKQLPQVKSLRDITLAALYECVNDELIRKRCAYVIKENARLHAGCEDLKIGDLESFGQKMYITHDGLKNDYEVSCGELDYLVNAVMPLKGVIGARMMGGGFGGCTINLIKDEAIEETVERLSYLYEKDMGKKLTAYVAETAEGTSINPDL